MSTMEVAARRTEARCAGAVRRQLYRFPKVQRDRVIALADAHPRLGDLAVSFPALLFALAGPRDGFDPRVVIARVCAGESLKSLCEAAEIPSWLRAVPPEAFVRPLPVLPNGDAFKVQIANHIPDGRKVLPYWLAAIADAAACANEAFALWIAREIYHEKRQAGLTRLLCLWAWYSTQPGTAGYMLMQRRWTNEMGYRAALDAASVWHDRVELEIAMGDTDLDDVWLTPTACEGYTFVPIRSTRDLVAEAEAMQNCVMTYGYQLAANTCRLWSMRKDLVRVATVEVGRSGTNPYPVITQLAGPRNEACDDAVWWAAHTWVHRHGPNVRVPERAADFDGLTASGWRAMWKPYWRAKGRVPDWLPLAPCNQALYRLGHVMQL